MFGSRARWARALKEAAQQAAWEASNRQQWQALALYLDVPLERVDEWYETLMPRPFASLPLGIYSLITFTKRFNDDKHYQH